MEAVGWSYLPSFGCDQLPAWVYTAEAGDFTVRVRWQTSAQVPSEVPSGGFFSSTSFDLTPQPDGVFSATVGRTAEAVYTGDPADKGNYTHIGLSACPVWAGQDRPELRDPGIRSGGGGSSNGDTWGALALEPGWEDVISFGGGGSSSTESDRIPSAYAADLYLNGELAAELTLLPDAEGGLRLD